ncbi:uncharacterized protein BDV17DRAFT_66737 [Aspergillus undulatus]|uniref:uncharacterized protein n=1 Tax=Aspergillus undulatus TaxID=1810928 RepID=UPI003CCD62D8
MKIIFKSYGVPCYPHGEVNRVDPSLGTQSISTPAQRPCPTVKAMSRSIKEDVTMEESVGFEHKKEQNTVPVIDPGEERKVVRKLDRVIMPLMAIFYFFQYLDKQSINYAAVFDLQEDLKLTGSEFSWAVSLFYFGQLVSQYPVAYLMSRVRITYFVGVAM